MRRLTSALRQFSCFTFFSPIALLRFAPFSPKNTKHGKRAAKRDRASSLTSPKRESVTLPTSPREVTSPVRRDTFEVHFLAPPPQPDVELTATPKDQPACAAAVVPSTFSPASKAADAANASLSPEPETLHSLASPPWASRSWPSLPLASFEDVSPLVVPPAEVASGVASCSRVASEVSSPTGVEFEAVTTAGVTSPLKPARSRTSMHAPQRGKHSRHQKPVTSPH